MADHATLLDPYSEVLMPSVGCIANISDESRTCVIIQQNFTFINSTRQPNAQSKDTFDFREIIYGTIGFVGIVDNLMAVLVILLHKPLRQRLANYFLVNKCIQDLIAGVFLILLYTTVKKPNQLKGVALEVYCRLWSSKVLYTGFLTSSLFSLAAVTFEKYLEIARPIQHRVKMTKKRVLCSIGILTAFALAFKMAYTMSVTQVVNGSCKFLIFPNFAAQVIAGTSNVLVEYFLPLMVIAYSYIGMARSLRKTIQPASFAMTRAIHPKMIRARRNIIKTLITVVLAFVICISFKEFILTLQLYNLFKVDFRSWWFAVSQTMAFLTCCIDPIIYLIQYEEFRRGAKKLFCQTLLPCRKTTSVVREITDFSIKTVNTL